jgi:hypothetical protein
MQVPAGVLAREMRQDKARPRSAKGAPQNPLRSVGQMSEVERMRRFR